MKKTWSSVFLFSALWAPQVMAQSSQPVNTAPNTQSALQEQAQGGTHKDLSLADAVKLALENSPDLKVTAAQAANAQSRYEQVKDATKPTVAVGVNLNQYTRKIAICLADLDPCPEQAELVTRGLVTTAMSANVSYPITAQFTSIKGRAEASRYEIDGIEISREVTKREVAWQVEQAYLQLLKITAAKETATEGVKLAQAQVDRVKKFYDVGALAKNDLLRAELSLAQAQQTEISIQTGVLQAEGALATLLGFSINDHINPTEKYSDAITLPTISLEQAVDTALKSRPELAQLDSQVGMMGALKDASKSALYPQVNLTASAQYFTGSAFQEGVDVFATLGVNWVVMDWGLAKDQIATAESNVAQVKANKDRLIQGIVIDVRSKYLGILSAKASLDLAEKSIESAEENQRITTARFDAKSATTTDLLDAQVLLTRAKISVVTARYDYYIALAGLKKSMGETSAESYFSSKTTAMNQGTAR